MIIPVDILSILYLHGLKILDSICCMELSGKYHVMYCIYICKKLKLS